MKRSFNYLVKLFLCFAMLITGFITPIDAFALTEEQVKDGASKGDIYNQQNNTVSSASQVIKDYIYANGTSYENGDVEVEKRIYKENDNGLYNIEFWIRGKEYTSTKTKDTYIVFVIDRSYTMGENSRWTNASKAVIDLSTNLSKITGIKMAAVGFSGGKASSNEAPYNDTVNLRTEFKSIPFTSKELGNYDTDNQKGGGTNIHAGLMNAYSLLNQSAPDDSKKVIVLLSDGVPTFHYDNNGYTLGSGNSNTDEKISKVPDSKSAAVNFASSLKNDYGIEIYTIGYELDKLSYTATVNGVYYDEEQLARDTLNEIATSSSHVYYADSKTNDNIKLALGKLEDDIKTFNAGYNPTIIDNIGDEFKLVGSNTYGGTKTLTTSNFTITNNFQKIGEFNVQINPLVKTDWYNTNNDFVWKYEKTNKDDIVTKTCFDDPEVYWEALKYDYKVNYYKDSITDETDENFLGGYTNKAEHEEIINISSIDLLKYLPTGYNYTGVYKNGDNNNIITDITIDRDGDNIINILYNIKKFNYVVNYYYADINNKYSAIPDKSLNIKNVNYGTNVLTSSYYLDEKDILQGYTLDNGTTNKNSSVSYNIVDNNVIIKIYYKRNSYNYLVNYYFNKEQDNDLTKNFTSIYGANIFAKDHYLEDIDNDSYNNKNTTCNTKFFIDENEDSNYSNITIKLVGNELNIYYINTSLSSEKIEKSANVSKITTSSTPITYTVNYNAEINNVKKDDKALIKITDYLPFEIYEDRSNLNGGLYNKKDKTITWIFEEDITEFKEIYQVKKDISYTVVYKNFAYISEYENNNLINEVNGNIVLTDFSTDGVKDDAVVKVEIELPPYTGVEVNNNLRILLYIVMTFSAYFVIKKENEKDL